MKMHVFKYLIFFSIFLLMFSSCINEKSRSENNLKIKYPENLHILLQSDWGGTESRETIDEHKIDRITFHHGGVEFKVDKDPIEYMKNLQSWSRSEKKWMDIPYHFLIDLNGKIYEGRSIKYPGDTNTTYDPTGHLLLCLMGNYEIQKVNSEQFKSIVDLSTFFCIEFKIEVDSLKGHKDYAETACPGTDFYDYLENGSLVKAIARNINNNAYLVEDK